MKLNGNTRGLIALITCVTTGLFLFGVLAAAIFGYVDDTNREIIYASLTGILAANGVILSHYFGSSEEVTLGTHKTKELGEEELTEYLNE